VDSLGAQLVSLKGPEGFEHLWVGDPQYWREHAPVLFPIVGALRDNRTQIGGEWYSMNRHGFAKASQFTLVEEGKDRLAYCLTADAETEKRYPFQFALTVAYTLTENGYETAFTVENTGDKPMPYAIGGHPGFNIPVDELRARLAEIDPARPVYVMCQSALRSYIACRILSQHGYDCYNFSGGYRFYEANRNDRFREDVNTSCGASAR